MSNKKQTNYYEAEILPSSKNDKNFVNKNKVSFVQKNLDLIHSEREHEDVIVIQDSGEHIRKRTGMVASRIKDRIYMMIQQKTVSTFNRAEIEKLCKKEVFNEMKQLDIQEIDKTTVEYAVEGKIREFIKKNFDNEFIISREDFLDIAQVGSNNLSYVMDKVIIPIMENSPNDIEKVIECSVDENYNKVEKIVAIPTMPKIGYTKYEDQNKEDHYFIRIDPDLLVRLVGINKNAPYATIYLSTKEKLDSKYTSTLYELLSRCVSMMTKFDKKTGKVTYKYKDLLKYFSSNLGKKKKRNPKYIKGVSPTYEMYIKRDGRQIWETDKDGNVLYEEDYKKTYNNFKKEILNVAISEYNNKTGYKVIVEELKLTKLGKISKIGAIEEITFVVMDMKPIKTNDFIASLYFFKENPQKLAFKEIKKALIIQEKSDDVLCRENIIISLNTTEELVEYNLLENNKAYEDIKTILNSKREEFNNYAFDVLYNVVIDKRNGERIGDSCTECLESLQKDYSIVIEEVLSKKSVREPSEFLPFIIVFEEKEIRINKSNYEEHKNKIRFLINENKFKAFKAFKSRFIKKDFVDIFFEEQDN